MKKIRLLSAALVMVMIITALATGCSTQNNPTESTGTSNTTVTSTGGTSSPAELEPITLNIMCPSWDVTVPKKDQLMWAEYEKKTNVHIEWQEVAQAAMVEKKSTLMASGDLPDAFWQYYSFTPEELALYGSQGVFVSLDDKAAKIPNLTKVMNDIPSARPSMTMSDGHIYAFPYITTAASELTLRYYINKKHLAQTGMEVPKTIEEYEAVMKAFKNINAGDDTVWPVYLSPGTLWFYEIQLMGSFGLVQNGFQQYNSMTYDPGDGKLKFIYTDPKLKEMWQTIARFYQEGLINPGAFINGYDYSKWVTDGTAGLVGSFSWSNAEYLYGDAPKDYAAVSALKGPYSQVVSWSDNPVRSVVAGIITSKCKYVDRAIEWFDYWYGEEGSLYGVLGTEGVTYTKKDGKYSYTDDILNYKGGVQLGAFQKGLLVYGAGYPYIEPSEDIKNQLKNKSYEDIYSCSQADIETYMPKDVWPAFNSSIEEQDTLVTFFSDMKAYVDENRIKFITGSLNFDSDWDKYVNTLNKLGTDKFVEIKQAQYERYKAFGK